MCVCVRGEVCVRPSRSYTLAIHNFSSYQNLNMRFVDLREIYHTVCTDLYFMMSQIFTVLLEGLHLLSVPSEGVSNAPHDGGWFNELFQNVGLGG